MFLGTFESGLDAKGRLQVPARFRASLRGSHDAIVVRPTQVLGFPCLEACDLDAMAELMAALRASAGPLDEGRQALALALFSDAHELKFDGGGRISVPVPLSGYAHLDARTLCVGAGDRFHIFAPAQFALVQSASMPIAAGARRSLGGLA